MLFGRKQGMMKVFNYRTNRATYWLVMAVLAILYVAAFALFPGRMHVTEFVLITVAIPRLHDIGRTGWWAGAALLAYFMIVFCSGFFLTSENILVVGGLAFVILLAGMMGLGILRGDPGENRFGPAPNPGVRSLFRPKQTQG